MATTFIKMEPVVGVEPTTYGLQNRCSATELNWLLVSLARFELATIRLEGGCSIQLSYRDVRAP